VYYDNHCHSSITFTWSYLYTIHTDRGLHCVKVRRVAIFLEMAFHTMLVWNFIRVFVTNTAKSFQPADWLHAHRQRRRQRAEKRFDFGNQWQSWRNFSSLIKASNAVNGSSNADCISIDAGGFRAGGCDVRGSNRSSTEVAGRGDSKEGCKDDGKGSGNGDMSETVNSSLAVSPSHPSAVPPYIVSCHPSGTLGWRLSKRRRWGCYYRF
jgi:hypothetical protein